MTIHIVPVDKIVILIDWNTVTWNTMTQKGGLAQVIRSRR